MNQEKKRMALIAHDEKKETMNDWVCAHRHQLAGFELYATGSTGADVEKVLQQPVLQLQSGPLGGDQQVGALITDRKIDILILFWDPMQPMPHEADIRALLRIAAVWNIPMACNPTTADFIMTSTLLHQPGRNGSNGVDEHQKDHIEMTPSTRKDEA